MGKQNLWAPWRLSYLQGLKPGEDPRSDGCFMCNAAAADLTDDERAERLVLLRDERGVLMMNRYPYTNGHLLVVPLAHCADLSDMTQQQRADLMELAELGNRLLKEAMNPQGINLGMNLGRCAGAGVPGHVHMHIVPRWHGDVNFMDVVGGVRVIPQALEEGFVTLSETLRRLVAV